MMMMMMMIGECIRTLGLQTVRAARQPTRMMMVIRRIKLMI